jgi:hypothetical protein
MPLVRLLRLAALCFALVVAAGCAFQRAMQRGDELAAQHRYGAAVEAYRHALELEPGNDEARRKLAAVTPRAVAEVERDIAEAVAAERFEVGVAASSYLATLDRRAGDRALERVEGAWQQAIARREAGDTAAAYVVAVRALRALRGAGWPRAASDRLRAALVERSSELAKAGDYAAAVATLDLVTRHEPERDPEVQPLRQTARAAWADALVARGREADAGGHPGVAAVFHARAFEVAGREIEAAELRHRSRRLARDGAFLLEVRVEDARDEALRRELAQAAGAIAGVGAPTPEDDEITMNARLSLHAPLCRDERRHTTKAHHYVSGTREQASAHHQMLARELAANEARLRDVDRRIDAARGRRERAERQLGRCQAPPPAPAQAEGRRRRRPPPPPPAQRGCAEARASFDEAERELAALAATRSQLTWAIGRLVAELQRTPRAQREATYATFHYRVEHVTRRCPLDLDLALELAWAPQESHRLEVVSEATDATNDADPFRGVMADPLDLPPPSALQARGRSELVRRALALIAPRVRDYYQQMADNALVHVARDADEATDSMVIVLLGGAPHLDASRRDALAASLRERYGLERWQTLLPAG